MIGFAVVPLGGPLRWPWMDESAAPLRVQVASVDIGLLYILAVGSLGVYAVVLGGWSSNNKYALYGGMRAAAQMLSYEVPLGLCLLACILTTGELRLEHMVERQQAAAWTCLLHPLVFVIFFTTALAEANRAPFDLAECEQELVGGFHTEFSAMKWALFFFGEYAHMITSSCLISALFLGGWELFPFAGRIGQQVAALWWLDAINRDPGLGWALARLGIFCGKIALLLFGYMWVRWTLPRFRFDQLMRLAWKGLVPLSLGLVVLAGMLLYAGRPTSAWAPAGNAALLLLCGVVGVMSGRPITGRQRGLPAVSTAPRAGLAMPHHGRGASRSVETSPAGAP
jgi:NADH-quinone oxidoreductase subunit H